jgi:hypothetical protein
VDITVAGRETGEKIKYKELSANTVRLLMKAPYV